MPSSCIYKSLSLIPNEMTFSTDYQWCMAPVVYADFFLVRLQNVLGSLTIRTAHSFCFISSSC